MFSTATGRGFTVPGWGITSLPPSPPPMPPPPPPASLGPVTGSSGLRDGSVATGWSGLADGPWDAGPDGAADGGAVDAAPLEQAAIANATTAMRANGRANRAAEGELICARRPALTISSGWDGTAVGCRQTASV